MNSLYERAQAVRAGDQSLLADPGPGPADAELPALPDALSPANRARVEALWRDALEAHQQGRIPEAEQHIRAVLELEDTDEAWHFLAMLLALAERFDESQGVLEELMQRQPGSPGARHDLANVCRMQGDISRAEGLYRQAIALDGTHADASRSLGQMLLEQGRNEDAAEAFDTVISLGVASADDHCALGMARLRAHDLAAAREAFSAALALDPQLAQAHSSLGEILRERGVLEQATAHFRKAAELQPETAGPLIDLGVTLIMVRRFAEAVDALSLAVSIKPQRTDARVNLATATLAMGNAVDAADQLHAVLVESPGDGDALNNLGNAERELGNIDGALAHFRAAVDARPDSSKVYSNLLLASLYDEHATPQSLFELHTAFAQRYGNADDRMDASQFNNTRDPVRRLRIAYMSPDLRRHPVGQYLLGVLSAHDREHFEVICYADVSRVDAVTELCQARSDRWVSTVGLDDAALTARIREDEIDLLIDLSGHTARNRMRVLAARAAPVQITWIGYVATTGLDSVDYLLADEVSVPEEAVHCFTETVLRIEGGYLCYAAPQELPPPEPPPCLQTGHVTFGCFSALAKLSDATLEMWAQILHGLPDAQLLLQRGIYVDERVVEMLSERGTRIGLDMDRVRFSGGLGYEAFLKSYSGVDIMLDTTPFSGGSTTAEALWMGVPVVTLAGERFGSRTSASLLAGAGLSELIAHTPADYVAIAQTLARDPGKLEAWRTHIRVGMGRSNSGDPTRLTPQLEKALRHAWQRWCELTRAD